MSTDRAVVLFRRSDIIHSMKKKIQKKEVAMVFTSDEVMSLLRHIDDRIQSIIEAGKKNDERRTNRLKKIKNK